MWIINYEDIFSFSSHNLELIETLALQQLFANDERLPHASNRLFYSRKMGHLSWLYFWNLQVQVKILT